jgi:RNA polymerase sigma factor (sigma-70 family)
MSAASSPTTLKCLSTLFHRGTTSGATDCQLLERFLDGSRAVSASAFEALVDRHGPMVLRICRQILGDSHDAEDASQATLLVLARRAGSIRQSDSVASWLFGVACRISARVRVDRARQRARERRGAEMAAREAGEEAPTETWPELYDELGRLPEKFRLPIVLCHLEGLSYDEAAQRLSCPVRTIQSRLSRGRDRLQERLRRRGVGPAAAVLSAAMRRDAFAESMPEAWKSATINATLRATSSAGVSASVAALAAAASRRTMRETINSILIGSLLAGALAYGWGWVSLRELPQKEITHNPYRVTLSNGTSIEIVAVSSDPMGAKTWWTPDGRPLADAPVDNTTVRISSEAGRTRAILIRIAGSLEHGSLRWLPSDVDQYWGVEPTRGGKSAPGMEMYVASFPKTKKSCSVLASVGVGSWTNDLTHDGRVPFSTARGRYEYYFGKSRGIAAGTAISIAHNVTDRQVRLVAIDREGHQHLPVGSSAGGGNVRLLDAEFPVACESIVQFRFQTRPFEKAEIPAIALEPREGSE